MKKTLLILSILVTGQAVAAVDLSPSAPDAKIATSKQYVDSGLSKKANKTDVALIQADVAALDTAVADIETALDGMDLTGVATQTWVQSQNYLTTSAVSGKQDALTCAAGQMMVFTDVGEYECRTLAVGEYTGE